MHEKRETTPEVGMGATICHWTDRTPVTVIAVLGPKKIVIREDHARRTDSNGMSETQSYEYSENPEGRTYTFTLRKNGRWCEEGQSNKSNTLHIGSRRKYHDYSF